MTNNDKAIAALKDAKGDFQMAIDYWADGENFVCRAETTQVISSLIDKELDRLTTPQSSADLGRKGDGGKGLLDQQHEAGHKFTVNDDGLAICDHCKEPMTFPVKKCQGPLAALRAAVEGMKKPISEGEKLDWSRYGEFKEKKIWNAAITEVLRLIDEVERV